VKLSFNLKSLEQKVPIHTFSFLVSVGLFLILISKFYYLWGTIDGLRPGAPKLIILIRDLIIFGFLGFFGILVRNHFPNLKLFWRLWFFGLAISLLHLYFQKDLVTWGQHYLRNTLIPLLFYPVIYGLLKAKIQISLRHVLSVFFILNLATSYFQLFTHEFRIRPTGFFGDPIINTMILLWSLAAFLSLGTGILSLMFGILVVILLQYISSFSAILSIAFAVLILLVLTRKSWMPLFRKQLKWIFVSLFCLIGAFYGVSRQMHNNPDKRFEGLTSKIGYLYGAWQCEDKNCYKYWSFQGRIESNLRPIRFCQQSFFLCLVGNLENSQFEKIESTPGSLVTNWGALFCFLFLSWCFFHISKLNYLHVNFSEIGKEDLLWSLIFISGLAFAAFNALMYRYPVNIFFYASMGYLHFRSESAQSLAVRS